ncbi:MAG: carboxypeptidase regulatory-like domain-containing protein [Longimicrobiaceae bacterium]
MSWLRRLRAPCCGLLLSLVGAVPAGGQSAGAGVVVTGTVREAGGAPIPGATVSVAGDRGVAARTVTDAAGRYRLSLPHRGEGYELRVERVGYFRFSTPLSLGDDGGAVIRDVRLNPSSVALQALEVRSTRPAQRPAQGPTPGGNEEAWQSVFTDNFAIAPGDLGAIALLRPGAVSLGESDDGGLPRLSLAGRDPSQNHLLVDGASFGASTLPPEALRSTSIVSSSYDPARGQFSGGQIAATTRSGTNLTGGALRLRLEPGVLQVGSVGPGGDRYTVAELDGGAGGALIPGRLFWFGAFQASRNSTTPATLASLPASTLAELGLSADSVTRFRSVTSGLGFASGWQRGAADAVARKASGVLRMDFHATQAHTLTLRLDGRGAETRGLGASAYGIPGGDDRVSRGSWGVLGQVASYLGSARNELRAYRSADVRRHRGGAGVPGGYVDVLSDLGEGRSGLTRLSFGESAFPFDGRSTLTELSDELLVRLRGDEHRLKLGFTASREATRQHGLANGNGTFTFRSLADLEEGRPLSFTRALGGDARGATADYGALFAAHLWHAAPRLWVIQGVRVEETRWPHAPAPAEALRAAFGLPAGRVAGPRPRVSPRAGFVYETPGKQWTLRGGAGRFVGTLPLAALAEAFGETGAAGSRLVCLGPATPTPEWERYAADPGSIPTRCADGAGGAGTAPAATLFAPGFSPPGTWRASAGGGGPLLRGRRGRLDVHLDATLVLGSGEPLATDRNLAAAPRFVLADEGSRPVFAPAEGIDASTGAIDPALGRLLPAFGTVRQAASRGRSAVTQLTTGITLLTHRYDVVAAYYTHTRASDEVTGFRAPGGFSAPVAAGDPNRALRGPSDVLRRHSFQLQGIHPVGRWVEIGVVGRLVSGAPFTPRVDADVNGDGVANDAAFIFGAAADPGLARAMDDLRRNAPAGVRRCLERQAGRIAARNSCTGPWRASLDLQVNLPVDQGTRGSRFTASVAVNNVLAGLGWGGDAPVDPTLLRVQGFDAQRRAFSYAVNSSFGGGSGRRDPLRLPTTLTLTGRIALGSDPARQPMLAMTAGIRARGRTAAELGGEIAARIPNPPAQVLALADTLGLALTEAQGAALRARAERLGARLAPLTDTLAEALSVVERGRDEAGRAAARARGREAVAAMQAELDAATADVRALLTPGQWARLPEDVRRPARQLVPPRTMASGGSDSW